MDNCKTTTLKRVLSYLNKHNLQSIMLFGALALGFIIAVSCVGYAIVLEAKHGCFKIFLEHGITK